MVRPESDATLAPGFRVSHMGCPRNTRVGHTTGNLVPAKSVRSQSRSQSIPLPRINLIMVSRFCRFDIALHTRHSPLHGVSF